MLIIAMFERILILLVNLFIVFRNWLILLVVFGFLVILGGGIEIWGRNFESS